jgi:hypothetical protein
MGLEGWRGPQIAAKIAAASRFGIDKTTSEAVLYAKQNHTWQNVTGTLEGSIQMRGAEPGATGRMEGRWGSFTVNYALWLEIGTEHMPARPYLRPAADANYPSLRRHIREAFALEMSL